MPRGGWRAGAGRKPRLPGSLPPLPTRLTASPPDRRRAIEARERAAAFLEKHEDALIEEVWTTGTLRDRLELYRFLKPYAHGVAKLPADTFPPGQSFGEVMVEVARERQRAEAPVTTTAALAVTTDSRPGDDGRPKGGGAHDDGRGGERAAGSRSVIGVRGSELDRRWLELR